MNAITERWIGGCWRELLDRTLIWNQAYPRQIVGQYETPQSAPAGHSPPRRRAAETAT